MDDLVELMSINGLTITLSQQPELAGRALAAIRSCKCCTAGAVAGRWLPVAVEARDEAHARELHDWLEALVGVDYVDVVFAGIDAGQPAGCAEEMRTGGRQ